MEHKSLMVKQLFDRGISAGKIFKQLKCLDVNGMFIQCIDYWVLIDVKIEPCLGQNTEYCSYKNKSALKELVKRYEEIYNVLQIKWLQK